MDAETSLIVAQKLVMTRQMPLLYAECSIVQQFMLGCLSLRRLRIENRGFQTFVQLENSSYPTVLASLHGFTLFEKNAFTILDFVSRRCLRVYLERNNFVDHDLVLLQMRHKKNKKIWYFFFNEDTIVDYLEDKEEFDDLNKLMSLEIENVITTADDIDELAFLGGNFTKLAT